jgi:beta-glucosidase
VRLTWRKPKRAPEALFAREIEAAKNADAVIAVVGLGTNYEREGRDKTDLSLPAEQLSLLQALKAVNDDLIVVLENGSAVAIPWIAENAAAILEMWYPGEQGGTALADLIYGNVSPSGRLPLSFPAKTEDLPPFDDYEMDHGRTYMYHKAPPLYPFGFGLSYTTFRYSDLRAARTGASVTVENTGNMDAEEVVQLYIDSAGYPGQPKVRLKGFKRIALKAGENKRVEFTLTDESFSLFDEAGARRVLPGTYSVYIGGGLPDEQSERAIVEIG